MVKLRYDLLDFSINFYNRPLYWLIFKCFDLPIGNKQKDLLWQVNLHLLQKDIKLERTISAFKLYYSKRKVQGLQEKNFLAVPFG
jgi:hypothetical protein